MADTPREIAERLASTALEYAPAELESLVHRTLAVTQDPDVQSRLTWIAGMYLDRHPGAFSLSRPLVEQCLRSTDFDELLAGLKGIQHCNASADEIVSSLVSVMKRTDQDQKFAALYQLSNVLARPLHNSIVSSTVAAELNSALQELVVVARDDVDREIVNRCIAQLKNLA